MLFCPKQDLSSRADAMERLIGLMLEGAQKRIDATIKSITHVVIDYINEHISQDIGITDLSRVTGYSTGYLSRVFRQEEGVSIHEYMTTMRMNLARELLINTNMRVYEIAAHCAMITPLISSRYLKAIRGVPRRNSNRTTNAELCSFLNAVANRWHIFIFFIENAI